MKNLTARTLEDVRDEIDRFRPNIPWRVIATFPRFQGVPAATLCAIYKHGRDPQNAEYRRILGLPVLAPAPVCARCGVVHLRRTCPPAPSATPRRRRPSRKARNRLNVRIGHAWLRYLEAYWAD